MSKREPELASAEAGRHPESHAIGASDARRTERETLEDRDRSTGAGCHAADGCDPAQAARSYCSKTGSEEVTAEVVVAALLARGPVTLAMLDAGYEALVSDGGDWVDNAFIEWRDANTCGGLRPQDLYPLVEAVFLAMVEASPERFFPALHR
jgi:hypothetical protein